MKYPLLASMAAAMAIPFGTLHSSAISFAPSSRLASGNWVKVGVDKSGIYEISYARLREMGFSDPTRVGVLGRGGNQLEINFTDEKGEALNPDDLSPVAVLHRNGRIYFYGQGTESFRFTYNSKLATQGYYQRVAKNLYSDLGYYFLSDTDGARMDMETPEPDIRRRQPSKGISYISHEEDLAQNTSHSGQLFWGESFNNGNPSRREWSFDIPGVDTGVKAMMECYFYSERLSTGTLEWGVAGSDDIRSGSTRNYNSLKFRPQDPLTHTTTIPADNFNVYVDYHSDDNQEGIANLDYWTLTFGRSLPDLRASDGSRLPHQHIAYLGIGRQGELDMTPLPDGVVFNVSDPQNTQFSETFVGDDGRSVAVVSPGAGATTELYIADLSLPQLQIKGYSQGYTRITNQDLHSLADEGASLLIIAVPGQMQQAERLARLHREHDAIRVAVASTEQAYNEFSGGVPDPMAYRSLAKMLYESEGEKLSNVLLLGPLYSDFRGVDVKRDPSGGIIAYQSDEAEPEKGAANINDFVGMMSDRLPDTRPEKWPVEVGVGILPCRTPEEADAYIDKVERYLADDSHAYRLNRMLTIGGLGDRHTHDLQAISLGKYLNTNNSNRLIASTLIIDAYGSREAGKRFRSALDEGVNIATYFGHGAPGMLGKDKDFFSAGDVGSLSNRTYPFMFFAGCILSNSDRGIRGIAESMVLSHDGGLIGAVLASRDTWSGENMDLMKILHNRMYKDGNSVVSPPLDRPLTIGQVFARAKTQSTYANELSYQLLCDPALTIPVATLDASPDNLPESVRPGDSLKISGSILDNAGRPVEDFKGTLVARLMYPERSMESPDIDTGSREEGDTLSVPIIDVQAAALASEVKGGRFSFTMKVPRAMRSVAGSDAILHICAYDTDLRLGAASSAKTRISTSIGTEAARPDTVAPVIAELSYDPSSRCLRLSVTDNEGLDTSSAGLSTLFRLMIDGKSTRLGGSTITRFMPDAEGYDKLIPVDWLPDGRHTARVEITDVDGNLSARELSFFTGEENPLILRLIGEAARDEALFETGGMPEDATLEITTAEGEPVASMDARGEIVRWGLTRDDGSRVAPGLYRAVLREGRNSAEGRHSETVYVPVMGKGAQ